MDLISNSTRKKICDSLLNRQGSITTYEYLYLERYSGLSINKLGDLYPDHIKYVNAVNTAKHYSIHLRNPRCSPFIKDDDFAVFRDDLDDKYDIFKEIEQEYVSVFKTR